MDPMNSNGLPRRLASVDGGVKRKALVYTARPDVILRFLRALRRWNPDFTVEVEPLEDDEHGPPRPLWCLRAWEN